MKKIESLEFRDNIEAILKKIDSLKADYGTTTAMAVVLGFELGFKKGLQCNELQGKFKKFKDIKEIKSELIPVEDPITKKKSKYLFRHKNIPNKIISIG